MKTYCDPTLNSGFMKSRLALLIRKFGVFSENDTEKIWTIESDLQECVRLSGTVIIADSDKVRMVYFEEKATHQPQFEDICGKTQDEVEKLK